MINKDKIEVCGQYFDKNLSYFSLDWSISEIEDMSELSKVKEFLNLKSVSLNNTNLNDIGLRHLCMNRNIDNLNLQETEISNSGLKYLSLLKNLKYLRLKENYQLNNDCIKYINNINNLLDLQINETSIDQDGLKELKLKNLENIILNIQDDNYSYNFLIDLSSKLPNCNILAKGKAEFYNGKILWSK